MADHPNAADGGDLPKQRGRAANILLTVIRPERPAAIPAKRRNAPGSAGFAGPARLAGGGPHAAQLVKGLLISLPF